MSSQELVDIVDENNEVIKTVTRAKMRKEQLPHRASYIALCNSKGNFLVEVRTLNKDYAPGLFDAVVGGVIQHGEDFDESAKRELLEEVGIDADLKEVEFHSLGNCKIVGKSKMRYFYGYLYLAKTDLITKRQASEVSGIMYLPFEDIIKLKKSKAKDTFGMPPFVLERKENKNIFIYLLITTERSRRKRD